MVRPSIGRTAARGLTLLGGLALLLQVAMPASGHSLQVFASADRDLISGSVYFAGGHAARGASVQVFDSQGNLLAELAPDARGQFSYRAPEPEDYRIVAESADGHRAEWRIAASELGAGFVEDQGTRSRGRAAAQEASTPAPDAARGPAAQAISSAAEVSGSLRPENGVQPRGAARVSDVDPALVAAIEAAVAHQIRPLREELAAARGQAALRDVLGGLGYIFGLAGLGLWWAARRSRARRGSLGDE